MPNFILKYPTHPFKLGSEKPSNPSFSEASWLLLFIRYADGQTSLISRLNNQVEIERPSEPFHDDLLKLQLAAMIRCRPFVKNLGTQASRISNCSQNGQIQSILSCGSQGDLVRLFKKLFPEN